MDISELSKRAMEIRARFAALEQTKFRREWTKEEVMQGFVVDVGDLMKLVMAKSGLRQVEDVDHKLAHELSDCLWSVLVLAQLYGIDLEREFTKTMDALDVSLAAKKPESNQTPVPPGPMASTAVRFESP
jgi:NTP pyrophosphatase (non-canonical NTP hydrolase)